MRRRAGLTLVEVLVVMAVAGVLTGLLVMGLRRTKTQTSDLQNVSNIRLSMQDFLAWSAEHEERWPTMGLPWGSNRSSLYGMLGQSGAAHMESTLYFSMQASWPSALAGWRGGDQPYWYEVGGPDLSFASAWGEGAKPVGPFPTRYLYSDTLRTTPEMWQWPGVRALRRFDELIKYAAEVRVSQVRFPSSKGVLCFDAGMKAPGAPDRELQIGWSDGSAGQRRRSEARPTAHDPTRFRLDRGEPVLATLDGYIGSDY